MDLDDELERYRQQRRMRRVVAGRPLEGLRAPNEDDDGYDPYSDFMDALARKGEEEPEADPWR